MSLSNTEPEADPNNNLMMRRAGLSRWEGGIYFGCSVDDGRDLNLEIGIREKF